MTATQSVPNALGHLTRSVQVAIPGNSSTEETAVNVILHVQSAMDLAAAVQRVTAELGSLQVHARVAGQVAKNAPLEPAVHLAPTTITTPVVIVSLAWLAAMGVQMEILVQIANLPIGWMEANALLARLIAQTALTLIAIPASLITIRAEHFAFHAPMAALHVGTSDVLRVLLADTLMVVVAPSVQAPASPAPLSASV